MKNYFYYRIKVKSTKRKGFPTLLKNQALPATRLKLMRHR